MSAMTFQVLGPSCIAIITQLFCHVFMTGCTSERSQMNPMSMTHPEAPPVHDADACLFQTAIQEYAEFYCISLTTCLHD